MVSTLEIVERLSRNLDPAAARDIAWAIETVHEAMEARATLSEFTELKGVVKRLAEAQERTERRIEELAQAQKRTEENLAKLTERMDRLEVVVAELVQAQKRTEENLAKLTERVDRLTERVDRLTERMDALVEVVERHEVRLAKLDGRTLELEFRNKASAYLGTVLRGTRVIPVGDLGDELEEVLEPEEWAELTRADLILRGRAVLEGKRQDIYAVVEVSVTVAEGDVERAARRAALLRKKGWKTVAVAAGEEADAKLIEKAAQAGVAVIQDGQQFNWSEALAKA
jgi:prefoldin subunit 5